MRFSMWSLAVCSIMLVAVTCSAQGRDKTLFIRGTVEPPLRVVGGLTNPRRGVDDTNPQPGEMHIRIRISGEAYDRICNKPASNLPDKAICSSTIYGFQKVENSTSVRLEIISPGFKKYSKNFPGFSDAQFQ